MAKREQELFAEIQAVNQEIIDTQTAYDQTLRGIAELENDQMESKAIAREVQNLLEEMAFNSERGSQRWHHLQYSYEEAKDYHIQIDKKLRDDIEELEIQKRDLIHKEDDLYEQKKKLEF